MTDLTADLLVADVTAPTGSRSLDVDDFKAPATGASTEATLAAFEAANHADLAALAGALASILAKLPSTPALDATIASLATANHADLLAILAKLPADASTGAKQDTQATKLDTLHADLGTDGTSPPALPGGATGVRGWLRALYNLLSGTLTTSVSNFPATQPVSAAALPLPAGAATDASVTAGTGAAGTSPPALASSASGIIGWLRKIVDTLTGGIGVTGTFWQATQPVSGTVTANAGTGTFLVASGSTSKGYQQLTSTAASATIASLCSGSALPTGAAKCLIRTTATVRLRDDATNPSSTVGFPVNAGETFDYDADQLAALKVYGAATLDVWFRA